MNYYVYFFPFNDIANALHTTPFRVGLQDLRQVDTFLNSNIFNVKKYQYLFVTDEDDNLVQSASMSDEKLISILINASVTAGIISVGGHFRVISTTANRIGYLSQLLDG